jgi:hypothetical protein
MAIRTRSVFPDFATSERCGDAGWADSSISTLRYRTVATQATAWNPKIQICVDVYAKPYYFMQTIFGILCMCVIARKLFLVLHGHKRAM